MSEEIDRQMNGIFNPTSKKINEELAKLNHEDLEKIVKEKQDNMEQEKSYEHPKDVGYDLPSIKDKEIIEDVS